MFFVVALIYFAGTVLLAACIFLPAVRYQVTRSLFTAGDFLLQIKHILFIFSGHSFNFFIKNALKLVKGFLEKIFQHQSLLIAAFIAIVFPVVLGIGLGQNNLAFFDDETRDADAKVALLLQGEHLIPPAPLPPEFFATPELESVRPLVREASRNWVFLDEEFRRRLLLVYKIMQQQHGYEMVLLEGYRSPERQARLAALGSQVTKAGANRSYHQYGFAADSAFVRNGRIVITEKDPWAMAGYRLYGEVAESVGLIWGGNWSLRDYGHVEYRKQHFKLPVR